MKKDRNKNIFNVIIVSAGLLLKNKMRFPFSRE